MKIRLALGFSAILAVILALTAPAQAVVVHKTGVPTCDGTGNCMVSLTDTMIFQGVAPNRPVTIDIVFEDMLRMELLKPGGGQVKMGVQLTLGNPSAPVVTYSIALGFSDQNGNSLFNLGLLSNAQLPFAMELDGLEDEFPSPAEKIVFSSLQLAVTVSSPSNGLLQFLGLDKITFGNFDAGSNVNKLPVPASLALYAIGLGALGVVTRRRRVRVSEGSTL